MKKSLCVIGICGHFGGEQNLLNGQTVKTKTIAKELERQLGSGQVLRVDTYNWKKRPFRLAKSCFGLLMRCKNVVILPAHNGLKVFSIFFVICNHFFHRKLHYIVIGGWLSQYLSEHRVVEKRLIHFGGIYVETSTMKQALEARGFSNVHVMQNCKELTVLKETELLYPAGEPYKLCTFSRVMREKGIEDAIKAVKAVNDQYGRTMFSLDVYGEVDSNQTDWFDKLKKAFPDYVKYGGMVPFNKSVEVLKDYFALLFPTHFYTEGIPGTIIDSYAAGVPVISARWGSFADVVEDGITGIGYPFEDNEALKKLLIAVASEPQRLNSLKKQALAKAADFMPQTAVSLLVNHL